MGRHFDTLVEIVKDIMPDNEQSHVVDASGKSVLPNAKDYLRKLIRRAALFEFPLKAEEIFPRTGKDAHDYNLYLKDYFTMSQEYGHVFITPFPLTAVEDTDSVVFLNHLVDDEYRVTFCRHDQSTEKDPEIVTIAIGDLNLKPPSESGRFEIPVAAIYSFHALNGIMVQSILGVGKEGFKFASQDLLTATISYLEEMIYIMDPENFIIYKESNESVKQRQREIRSKRTDILYKTRMRPHYICLSEGETRHLLLGQSKEPRPAHPVKGYWKKLMSPRFVNKQGQKIFVSQYFTGQGRVMAYGGLNYQVMVKQGPTRIVPYSQTCV